jgi:alpha-tubulin suppressor-like RCC1 family protein
MSKTTGVSLCTLICFMIIWVPALHVLADGGYFTSHYSVAVSADQRAIIIKNGKQISMTLSTGYTGEGEDFAWVIPIPVPPHVGGVTEAGKTGENLFRALDEHTAPVLAIRSPGGCFPAGTEVLTEQGPQAIENIRAGTRVQACDLATGEWTLAKVLKRISLQYDGDLITLQADQVALRTTGNHPFYVLRGERLNTRPVPQDVPSDELATGMGGRWVEARDLRAGDALADQNAEGLIVTALSSRQQRIEVFNLEVEGYHNYAVHREGILVHNKGSQEGAAHTAVGVTVYGNVTLEHYEVSILGASGASTLLQWLRDNGYEVDPAADKILDSYIRKDWCFVAVKLKPGEKRHYENVFLPPLTVKYHYDRLVFPLHISSVSTAGTARITLYVVAHSTVSSVNFQATPLRLRSLISKWVNPEKYVDSRIREAAGNGGRALVVIWKGEHPEPATLDKLMEDPFPQGATIYLTRLEARLPTAAMTEDIEFVLDPTPLRFGNDLTALGNDGSTLQWVPVPVPDVSGVTAIAAGDYHTVALKGDGTLWAWGRNGHGQLGEGSTTDRAAPVHVTGLSGITAIAAGDNHTVALKGDGTVWAWGRNSHGQLGDGGTTNRSAPVHVAGLSGITAIAAGGCHTVALRTDGTVWTWGWNGDGQLGDGRTTDRSAPVHVAGLLEVTAIAAGFEHTLALKGDGTLWAWGGNRFGQLGISSTTNRSAPVQVAGLSGVTAIAAGSSHTVALKGDGTLWAWGWNSQGQLGNGSNTNRSAPEQVTGLSGVTAIVAGSSHTVALKRDGTLWAWGWNSQGQLGNGSTVNRTVPVQVTRLSGVTTIAAGSYHTVALKGDGTPWAWGEDNFGQLGIGGTVK